MKLIEEIINYLSGENFLDEEDLIFLEEKGFYKTPHKFNCTCPDCIDGYDGYDYEEDDPYDLHFSNIDNEEAHKITDIEESLTDNRRRKQGKKGKLFSGKSKKNNNRRVVKKKLRYVFISDKSISLLEDKIPKPIKTEIEKLKGKYFTSYTKFKKELFEHLPETEQEDFKKYTNVVKNNITRVYKIPQYETRDDGYYITPRTFLNMKKNPVIINTVDFELIMKAKGNKQIQLTNKYGKILQPISLKKY